MSSSPEFSTLSFPALRTATTDDAAAQARVSGHAAGYAAGLRAAESDIAARAAALQADHNAAVLHNNARVDLAIALLNASAAALDARTVPVLETANDAIAESALLIAEAVVVSDLSSDGAAAASALHRALATVDVAVVHTVRMNPTDLATLGESVLAAAGVTFTADPALARGDAVTEFPNGYLDARIASALARAKAAIEEARS